MRLCYALNNIKNYNACLRDKPGMLQTIVTILMKTSTDPLKNKLKKNNMDKFPVTVLLHYHFYNPRNFNCICRVRDES